LAVTESEHLAGTQPDIQCISSDIRVIISAYRIEKSSDDHPYIAEYCCVSMASSPGPSGAELPLLAPARALTVRGVQDPGRLLETRWSRLASAANSGSFRPVTSGRWSRSLAAVTAGEDYQPLPWSGAVRLPCPPGLGSGDGHTGMLRRGSGPGRLFPFSSTQCGSYGRRGACTDARTGRQMNRLPSLVEVSQPALPAKAIAVIPAGASRRAEAR
jgi:hypothetical protein